MKILSTKVFSLIIIIIISTSCSKDNQIKSQVKNEDLNENLNQDLKEWTKENNIPNDNLRLNADVITYNNEAYLLPGKGGTRFSSKPEILKYSGNEWTQIATYDGFASAGGSRSIRNNDLIYILGGVNGSNAPTDEVRVFSITNNTFNDENSFPSSISVAYTETKAYFENNGDFSSYDFTSNIIESLPIVPINQPISSAIITSENNTIYALFTFLGADNFFAFDEGLKTWVQLPDFPGGIRNDASIVSTTTNIYAGLGNNATSFTDIWEYKIGTNEWSNFTEYPGTHFSSGFAFELDNKLFFGGGYTGDGPISNDVLNGEVYSIKVK